MAHRIRSGPAVVAPTPFDGGKIMFDNLLVSPSHSAPAVAVHQQASPAREWPERNQRARRYTEWTVANHPMPATMRLVLRAILLHVDAEMSEPCTARERTIAAKASLSVQRVTALL